MGAGQFGAGAGGAGQDPVYLAVPPSAVLPPRAIKYDPTIKQYVLRDANGNAIDVHPIDQIVVSRWTTEQGQSASSPLLGQRLRKLFAVTAPARKPQVANAEMQRVVQDLINAGDIRYLGTVLRVDPVNNSTVVVPSYVNLRDPLTDPRYPTQNALSVPITLTGR